MVIVLFDLMLCLLYPLGCPSLPIIWGVAAHTVTLCQGPTHVMAPLHWLEIELQQSDGVTGMRDLGGTSWPTCTREVASFIGVVFFPWECGEGGGPDGI